MPTHRRRPRAVRRPAPATRVKGDARVEVVLGLNAAVVAIAHDTPQVLVVRHPLAGAEPVASPRETADGLPFGPFDPVAHRTLEVGLRAWVEEQTGLELGYVEQLYTFADRGRHAGVDDAEPQVVSIGYLALTEQAVQPQASDTHWVGWYVYFPWEDRREERPGLIDDVIAPHLERWVGASRGAAVREERRDRVRLAFGLEGVPWEDEKVLERYELLYEAGLVFEAQRDRPELHATKTRAVQPPLGRPMLYDHRRILATAMSRLRGKIRYRPIVFELMPAAFTLLELQRVVESISGTRLHKQNFRRLVEKGGLVEGTGQLSARTGGRPAELYRFREEVLRERPSPGLRVGGTRASRAGTS